MRRASSWLIATFQMSRVDLLPSILSLVSPNDREKIVLLQEVTTCCIAESIDFFNWFACQKCNQLFGATLELPIKIGTTPDRIVGEVFGILLIAKIFQGVWPEKITHWTKCWRFLEPVELSSANRAQQKKWCQSFERTETGTRQIPF